MKLRAQLSMSQQELANHLGVSRTMVSMYEQGKRSLPTAALLKLAQLDKALSKPIKKRNQPMSKMAIAEDKTVTERLIKKFNYQLKYCKEKIYLLQKRRQDIELTCNSILFKTKLLEETLLNKEQAAKGKKEQLQYDLEQIKLKRQWKKVSKEAQFLLQYRIKLLQSEEKLVEKALILLRAGKFSFGK